jgi:phosphatidylglycerophosphate synthase
MQALPTMSQSKSHFSAGADFLLSAIVLACMTLLLSAATAAWLELGTDYLLRSLAGFCAAAAVVGLLMIKTPGTHGFGAANRITLLRVALVALIAAAIGEVPTNALSWVIITVVIVTLILDGFDGQIARRTQTSSAFGARFDMETDAALILVLSALCWWFDKAGVWILAAGGMRYGFVLAAKFLRWMREPLPQSRRRQTICILQSSFLLGVLSPLFPYPVSEVLAAGTLVMLGASFAIDIRWLWERHRAPLIA